MKTFYNLFIIEIFLKPTIIILLHLEKEEDMAKKKENSTAFVCSNCNYSTPRWLGRCPDCGEWNSFTECVIESEKGLPSIKATVKAKPMPLSTVKTLDDNRIFSGIDELDRVLGGGIMKRSCVLLGGEPGIGKSTLLLQCAAAIWQKYKQGKVLYVSGEESAAQIKNRAERLNINCEGIELLCTTKLEDIEDALNSINPIFVIVDSIQTVYSHDAGLIPGTVQQLKYCSNELVQWTKERDSVLFLVAHITKGGDIAGPKSLEHLVDTVISFERTNDDIRFLSAKKNRFGSIDELGIFEMTATGLVAIKEPSGMFIIKREGDIPAGVAIVPIYEGTRVFMVEIQALTVPAKASLTRVYSDNIDSARVSRVAAVLEKRLGLRFSDQDIYINVAGGIKIKDSAVDAALAAALYSARADLPLENGLCIAGEISLAGEIRPVQHLKQRVKTAKDLGFEKIVAPEKEADSKVVKNIKDLVKTLFG